METVIHQFILRAFSPPSRLCYKHTVWSSRQHPVFKYYQMSCDHPSCVLWCTCKHDCSMCYSVCPSKGFITYELQSNYFQSFLNFKPKFDWKYISTFVRLNVWNISCFTGYSLIQQWVTTAGSITHLIWQSFIRPPPGFHPTNVAHLKLATCFKEAETGNKRLKRL